MKKQEENLKQEFKAASPNSSERARIKNQLTRLQNEKFDKGECRRRVESNIEKEEFFHRLQNPTGSATNPADLASSIKEELRAVLNGSKKMETGDRVGEICEANQSKEFCYFGLKEEIEEMIANLPRKRQEPLDIDKITTRMVRVKRKDLAAADFDEIISLIRQVKNFLEEKDKQEQQNTENIKLNNPHLFTQ
ncbi:3665_t:CDS:1 [Funneliformis geosporum]|uniref:2769_t:CDS:1 n=1 Tax=Funneliformis geosporum TaxID=1117311 RepID=A0A9W4SVP6_9GLOM|nr:2769_t:CDS:1 [Funneliformis geosporum]CAI2186241.1 3665_t:CDS:1 [Funneliformis geosporum]